MKQLSKKKFNLHLPVHVPPREAQRVCVLEATDVGEGCDDGVFAFAVDDLVDMHEVVVDRHHLGLLFSTAENALISR